MVKYKKKPVGLRQLSDEIQSRKLTAEELVKRSLERAKDSKSIFISINDNIIEQARAIDRAIKSGEQISRLAGLPISLKDLFDVKGDKTLAGSKVLKNLSKDAEQDCDVVATLRQAGLLFVGRTNMSEFAFSGMGLNPHYGTPLSIWDRETGRIPGGSSSGSAVSVAEGIVAATMGSDTAGSCRIPAAFNGIVGVKPSFGRYSLNNVYPLSPTSDAPGPLAINLDSCFLLDQVITGTWDGFSALPSLELPDSTSLRLLVPEAVVLNDLDDAVQQSFDNAITWLGHAGIEIVVREMPVIDQCVELFLTRSIVGYEAWQHHQSMVEEYGDQYDPFVAQRIKNSQSITQQDQQSRYEEKAAIEKDFNQIIENEKFDGVIYPTVSWVPPPISETMDSRNTARTNLRCLRNTATANYFNGCSISLPCHAAGSAPVGLMVSLGHNQDDYLYRVAATVESILNQNR